MPNFIKEWSEAEVNKRFSSLKRSSIFVSGLKYILPFLIVLMAAALFYSTAKTDSAKKIVLVAKEKKVSSQPAEKPTMESPKFHGIDSNGQPYNISALKATETEKDVIALEDVAADFVMTNGDFVYLLATNGVYYRKTNDVRLLGDVQINITAKDNKEYQINAMDTDISAEEEIIASKYPVSVTSNIGTFNAKSFVINRKLAKINFNGPVKLVIVR